MAAALFALGMLVVANPMFDSAVWTFRNDGDVAVRFTPYYSQPWGEGPLAVGSMSQGRFFLAPGEQREVWQQTRDAPLAGTIVEWEGRPPRDLPFTDPFTRDWSPEPVLLVEEGTVPLTETRQKQVLSFAARHGRTLIVAVVALVGGLPFGLLVFGWRWARLRRRASERAARSDTAVVAQALGAAPTHS